MPELFPDFSPVSAKQWKQQIQYELKGAEYASLLWHSPEDITVKPFYHRDEDGLPAAGFQKSAGFLICQDIFVQDLEKSIWRAKDSLKRGAESLRFTIATPEVAVEKLLGGLSLEGLTLYFDLKFLSIDFVKKIDAAVAGTSAQVFLNLDPVGHLTRDGNWFQTQEKDNFEVLRKISEQTQNIHILGVDAALYQNAGANAVQQIAYTLAHLNEYLNRVPNPGTVLISVAVGSNYFFEIAKLRALRQLLELLSADYGNGTQFHLIATPTHRNKTLYDYNVNMLRTTTECMSAVLGGANAVSNLPYDVLYHKSNEFGERISRNQLLVLKHESYFDKVGNASDGSYYIESLTVQLAQKSLALFKELEAHGGFIYKLGDGTIQRKIQESADKEQANFDAGKEVLLGTNKYPNKQDRMKDDLELYPFVKQKPRKTLLIPIVPKRLAEQHEQERLAAEETTSNLNP